MLYSDTPFWFQLINYQKSKDIISNGLTIPYIIGAYQICNRNLNSNNPVQSLFLKIIESELNHCAVLQMCPNIRQYVVGIDDRQFCEQYMLTEISFSNIRGQSSLFITQNARQLGSNFDKVVEEFYRLYKTHINKQEYSWNKHDGIWQQFSPDEVALIKSTETTHNNR